MARHLGFPLLSFGRERPERVSTFTRTTPPREGKGADSTPALAAFYWFEKIFTLVVNR